MIADRAALDPAGLRVLVLEDEMLVALLIEDMLAEFGCVVVGPASSVPDALARVEAEAIDAALLDLNLSDGSGYTVADVLVSRAIPFAFLTGYGRAALRDPYRNRPILQKPFQMAALGRMLATLAAAAPD